MHVEPSLTPAPEIFQHQDPLQGWILIIQARSSWKCWALWRWSAWRGQLPAPRSGLIECQYQLLRSLLAFKYDMLFSRPTTLKDLPQRVSLWWRLLSSEGIWVVSYHHPGSLWDHRSFWPLLIPLVWIIILCLINILPQNRGQQEKYHPCTRHSCLVKVLWLYKASTKCFPLIWPLFWVLFLVVYYAKDSHLAVCIPWLTAPQVDRCSNLAVLSNYRLSYRSYLNFLSHLSVWYLLFFCYRVWMCHIDNMLYSWNCILCLFLNDLM